MWADGKTLTAKMSQTDDPNADAASKTAKRQALEFTGSWDLISDGDASILTLTQVGNQTNGIFTPGNGTLEGSADGGLLVLKWLKAGDSSGTGRMEFSPDGESLQGSFTETIGSTREATPATAARRPAPFAGDWLMRFDTPHPFVVTLQQNGESLTGSFKAGNTQIKDGNSQILNGKVLGNTAYFSWARDGGRDGTGWIKMGRRGRTFSGAFRNNADGTETPLTATSLAE